MNRQSVGSTTVLRVCVPWMIAELVGSLAEEGTDSLVRVLPYLRVLCIVDAIEPYYRSE